MSARQKRRSSSLTRGGKGLISFWALFLAVGLLGFQLLSSVFLAFSLSPWLGFRSLAAAIFPLSVATYFGYFAKVQVPARDSRAPIINSYVIFLFWTMLVFGLDGTNELAGFPLEELLYSSTLSVMMCRYKRRNSFGSLLACCCGVLSGSLAAVILFGMNPVTL